MPDLHARLRAGIALVQPDQRFNGILRTPTEFPRNRPPSPTLQAIATNAAVIVHQHERTVRSDLRAGADAAADFYADNYQKIVNAIARANRETNR